jgi:HSP20 family protein
MLTKVNYDPWDLMNQWRRDMERSLGGLENRERSADVTAANWAPAVDIKEEADAYVLYADLPGVDPKHIEVHMENGVLTIKGERTTESKQEEDSYTRIERVTGSFYRRFTLPESVDAEKISAKSQNGVLEVRIPKQEKVQPRRITVQE